MERRCVALDSDRHLSRAALLKDKARRGGDAGRGCEFGESEFREAAAAAGSNKYIHIEESGRQRRSVGWGNTNNCNKNFY